MVENLHRIGSPKIDQKQIIQVEVTFKRKASNFIEQISSLTDVYCTLPFRFMHSEMELKSYKIQFHKRLLEEDYDRSVQTTEQLEYRFGKPFFWKSKFHVSECVHTQIVCMWCSGKPPAVYEYEDKIGKINI